LFARTLEAEHEEEGIATPFDSGGLRHSSISRSNPAEPVLEFLTRHEVPVPDHRQYLGETMSMLFTNPSDYVEGLPSQISSPLGLTGGDERRWTHEVRIPQRVYLRGAHLQAVFAPRARVAADSHIESLFSWCRREGIDRILLDTPRSDDFRALQDACLSYMRRELY
jgi:hypothetical protein